MVDIDLAKYFDTVKHDLLIGTVWKEVKDESLVGYHVTGKMNRISQPGYTLVVASKAHSF